MGRASDVASPLGQEDPSVRRAAKTAIGAAGVWLIGIAPIPRVYTEPDAAKRLELLKAGRVQWVLGEHLAAAGTAAVPAAFARLALALPAGRAKKLVAVAASALLAGAPLFVSEIATRTSDIEWFAARRGALWPFRTYAWLHVVALGSLAGALWSMRGHRREAAAVGLLATGTGAVLARTGDVVPAVFYLGEQIAAASLLRRKAG
ncbi:hypothetical protein RBS60_05910 [Sinomonas sp. ASV486]|uniref:hypothetical protein n=1 Tax=Sinomonas sp. ASV486 TaxID=3051170 RepID=UPI0027DC5161|nr:hypothetical protein [Sinomonas sp. ASV486]MDQ4489731.1 hypothetical protein [Sinomonas sp. ASV486]